MIDIKLCLESTKAEHNTYIKIQKLYLYIFSKETCSHIYCKTGKRMFIEGYLK